VYYDEVRLLHFYLTGSLALICDLALEHISKSVRLWKETINPDERIILSRAVKVVPWFALACL
jgi:hypothetical protein